MSGFDSAAIGAALQRGGCANVAVHAFEQLGSTNAWFASGAGRDACAPAVCVTDHQTAGAGRRGRAWRTLPGNLTFSVLDRTVLPDEGAGALALVTGIAAARSLQTATGVPIRIKWPNDLFIDDVKAGGLLIEAQHEQAKRVRLVGGIGINLVADERLSGIGATSLACHGVAADRRDELLVSVVCAVFAAWKRFCAEGWAAFADEWSALDHLRDRRVTVYAGAVGSGDTYSGIARGVAADGALLVQTPAGLQSVHAGDVSVRAGATA